ncbi:MAG: hypothetical protein ACP6IQ_02075 [Candidatus Njordarchaeia archaeon]
MLKSNHLQTRFFSYNSKIMGSYIPPDKVKEALFRCGAVFSKVSLKHLLKGPFGLFFTQRLYLKNTPEGNIYAESIYEDGYIISIEDNKARLHRYMPEYREPYIYFPLRLVLMYPTIQCKEKERIPNNIFKCFIINYENIDFNVSIAFKNFKIIEN